MHRRQRKSQHMLLIFHFILLVLLVTTLVGCARDTEQTENKNQGTQNKNQETQTKDQATDPRERGAQIVAEYRKRDRAPNRHVQLRMKINAPGQPEKVYEFEIWRKDNDDQSQTLLHVTKPETERDLASLSTMQRGQKSVTVTYHRTTNEFQEYGSDRPVFGGLTIQEMLGEWDKFESRYLGEKEIEGVKMYEVENTLKQNETSTIKRFTNLFRSDNMLPYEAHLFDAQDKEIRTYRIREYKTVEGHPVIWRVSIENRVRNINLEVEMLSLSFEKLDDQLFSRDNLKRLAGA